MLSLTVFGISTGLSYLGYCDSSKRYQMVASATDASEGGHGVRYTTGFLTAIPLEFKGHQVLSLRTHSYDIFQKIEVSNGSAYTTTNSKAKESSFDQASVALNGIDISNLVPKLHARYANKLDQSYEANPPAELFNTNIKVGNFRVSAQNEVLIGLRRKYYGVVANPQTSYTVVGPFNGKSFYNHDETIIRKNNTIQSIQSEFESEMDAWKNLTVACVLGGLVCGACEVLMNK
jgi:hypothetical protein